MVDVLRKAFRRFRSRPADRYDITQGSLAHNILHLGWPILFSHLLQMAPDLYDAVWLGRLGSGAQAAAGLAQSVRFTMISVLMALSIGGGAVVARHVGAKDQAGANRAVLHGVLLMLVSSGTLGAIGLVFAEPLMRLAGADADVLPLAVRYARILFPGLIAMEMVPSVSGMLNAGGAPGIGLTMRLWVVVTMLVAEPLLVRWLGLEGAALALVGAHVVGMLWGLGVLLVGRAPVRIDVHDLRLDFGMIKRILRIAGPGIVQRGTTNLAMSVLMRLVSGYGTTTLAAWAVVQRVARFAQTPSMGLAFATPAMVGQNLGAGRPQRAERAVRLIARVAVVATVVIMGSLVLFAPQVLALFTNDPESLSTGVRIIRILSLGYLAFGLNFVYQAAQTGAGDTTSPMVINLVTLWLVQLPLAYGLPRAFGLGADGIWFAVVIGWFAQAALTFWRYRQGHWKTRQI